MLSSRHFIFHMCIPCKKTLSFCWYQFFYLDYFPWVSYIFVTHLKVGNQISLHLLVGNDFLKIVKHFSFSLFKNEKGVTSPFRTSLVCISSQWANTALCIIFFSPLTVKLEVTVGSIPFVSLSVSPSTQFSWLFSAVLSDIDFIFSLWIYSEVIQIKFQFCRVWRIFTWVNTLCSK